MTPDFTARRCWPGTRQGLREYYGRSAAEIVGKTDIRYNEEQGLLALIYDNDQMRVLDINDLMNGQTDSLRENDYVYYFSFEFCKE
jgi:hypothetical protein